MTASSSYTDSEWALLRDGPDWVYAALAAVDGTAALTTKFGESRGYANAMKTYKTSSKLIQEVIADESKPAKAISNATLSDAEEALAQISTILDKKASRAEADEFRDFLMSLGQSVAEAAGEGFLGIGENVSKKEASALDKIAKALKATDAEKKSRAETESKAADAEQKRKEAEVKARADAERKQKEAEAEAERKKAEAKRQAADAQRERQEAMSKRQADAEAKHKQAEAKREAAEAQRERQEAIAKRQADAEAKHKEAEAKRQAEAETKQRALEAEAAKKKEAARFIGEHTVVSGDSLSAIAKKYYGSVAKEKWMAIYEANKDLIGDNPNMIHPGQVFKIPNLTESE